MNVARQDVLALELLVDLSSGLGLKIGKPTNLAEFEAQCLELLKTFKTGEALDAATPWVTQAVRSARRLRRGAASEALKNIFQLASAPRHRS